MHLYETFAAEIASAIREGVLRPGDRLPSVREAVQRRGVSAKTVFNAYYLLEGQALVRAEPRSGYFVSPEPRRIGFRQPAASVPASHPRKVEVGELVYAILLSARDANVVPLGSPFPDPALFPLDRLRRSLIAALRRFTPSSTMADLPPGNAALKRQILKRYLVRGMAVTESEVVLTNGAMSALFLCLRAVTKPGDSVVIESPCFYICLQVLESLGLKAIEVATDCAHGIDLGKLAQVIKRRRPAACWLMTNYQNPLGSTMPSDKKRDLVALLSAHEIPLVEDDVYGELYFGATAPTSAKTFDRHGLVLHCSSFSKTLAPGYRVGWTAAGRFARKVEALKLASFLEGSVPVQAAISHFLQQGAYDAHLRRLRRELQSQQAAVIRAVEHYFPKETCMTRPEGGYFVWLELPKRVDAMELYHAAFAEGISTAPGPMFSPSSRFQRCIRVNTGQVWTAKIDGALSTLGRMVTQRVGATGVK